MIMKKLLFLLLLLAYTAMGLDNSSIRFANNDNDFRNDVLLVLFTEQELQ